MNTALTDCKGEQLANEKGNSIALAVRPTVWTLDRICPPLSDNLITTVLHRPVARLQPSSLSR
jgi:hypothetical protein